jgi:hypothetical protein
VTNKEFVLTVFRENGRADALSLRSRAANMDGTAIIAEEQKIPAWDPQKDYSGWPVGAPVAHDGNVFGLLQPHNASYYMAAPADLPALWSPKHTKDPAKAKPWLVPNGTSGLYNTGECCTFDGAVKRSLRDNNPYSPGDYPDWWEDVAV